MRLFWGHLKAGGLTSQCLWSAGLVGLAGFMALLMLYWPGSLPLSHVGGIMVASAFDIVNGVFYRPVFDGTFFGGTRYMPLFPLLHAGLMTLVRDPVQSGRLLMALSFLLMNFGLYALLRAAETPRRIALPLVFLAHACILIMLIAVDVKCDFLAAGLNVWGLFFIDRYENDGRASRLVWAALLFTGAFSAKLSTVFGLVSACAYWLIQGRRGPALRLALGAGGLMAVALAGIHLASHGRAWAAFQACASGGMDGTYAWKFLWWFILTAVQDPFFSVIFALALATGASEAARRRFSLPLVYFIVCTLATLAIFSSPGADGNHLIDLLLASLWLVGTRFTPDARPMGVVNWGFCLIVVLVALSWMPGAPSIKAYVDRVGWPTMDMVRGMDARLTGETGNILSENPLLPVLWGRRPIVLDAFQLRLTAREQPMIETEFNHKLESRFYRAVILMDWSGTPLDRLEAAMADHHSLGGKQFYGDVHFFPGFLERLQANYRLDSVHGPYVLYKPIDEAPQ